MTQRNTNLDLLRVIAAFAVIWLHVSAAVVVTDPDVHAVSWWVGNMADAFSRWCVPIFVMVSGALLLSTPSEKKPFEFYRKRAIKLFPVLLFWTVFYLMLQAAATQQFDLERTVTSIVIGRPYYHLWYLYMIIGLYFVTPFLRQIVIASSPNTLRFFVAASLVIAASESVHIQDTTFLSLFIPFVGYFVAGYYFTSFPGLVPRRTLFVLAILCGALVAFGAGALLPSMGPRSWDVMYSYLNPLVIIMSLCIFIFFVTAKLKSSRLVSLTQKISPITLGIYLIHPFWLKVLGKFGLDGFFLHPIVGILATTCVAFSLSIMSAALLGMTPVLRRTVV